MVCTVTGVVIWWVVVTCVAEAEGGSMGRMCFMVVVVWFTVGIILSAGIFIVCTPDVSK